MMSLDHPPTSIEEYAKSILQNGRGDEIAERISKEVQEFVSAFEFKDVDHILIIDRKSTKLYLDLFKRLFSSTGYLPSITRLRILESTGEIRYFMDGTTIDQISGKKFWVLLDTINDGKEIRRVISDVIARNNEVVRVYCYMDKKGEIHNLIKQYPKIVFTCLKEGSNGSSGNQHLDLVAYFQSNHSSFDTDHLIKEYRISPPLENSEACALANSVEKKRGGDLSEDRQAISTIIKLSLDWTSEEQLFELKSQMDEVYEFANVKHAQLRFTADNKLKNHTVLQVMSYINVNPKLDDIKTGKIYSVTKSCNLEKITKARDCELSEVCGGCIENQVAHKLIEAADKEIKDGLKQIGREVIDLPLNIKNPQTCRLR